MICTNIVLNCYRYRRDHPAADPGGRGEPRGDPPDLGQPRGDHRGRGGHAPPLCRGPGGEVTITGMLTHCNA